MRGGWVSACLVAVSAWYQPALPGGLSGPDDHALRQAPDGVEVVRFVRCSADGLDPNGPQK